MIHVLARGVPPVLLGALVFELRITRDPATLLAFLVSVLLAIVVTFDLRFLVNLWGFWILDTRGPTQLVMLTQMFLGGLILPITFFPDWLETLARLLPFAGTLQLPAEILMGKHTGLGLAGGLAGQLAWAAALYLAGRALLAVATRKVVVQGG